MKKVISILALVLVLVMAIGLCACGNGGGGETKTDAPSQAQTEVKVLGEGQTTFMFNVIDADGNETAFEIHTDKTTVGEALVELELIAGTQEAYGLYVKTVNGVTVDYDTDGKYWAFYINGEYASTGVDSTEIAEGATYAFKVE